MAVEAKINRSWVWRQLLTVALFLGFGIWGAYDGFVRYPAEDAHWQAYEDFRVEYGDEAPNDKWVEYAIEKGVSEKNLAVEKSVNNMSSAKTLRANYLNIRDLLGYDRVIMPLGALDVIQSYLGDEGGMG